MNNFDKIQQKSEYDIRFKYLYNKIPFPNGKLLKDFTLDDKIEYAKGKIREFFNLTKNEPKKISFSGGKDSTVLAHLVRQVEKELNLPNTPLVVSAEIFHPLTLEYLKSLGNYELLPPKKNINQIIEEYGYPLISKEWSFKIHHIRNVKNHGKYIRVIFGLGYNYHPFPKKYLHFLDKDFVDYEISHKCCDFIKGGVKKDKRLSFIGASVYESNLREKTWLNGGCLQYIDNKLTNCKPLSIWTTKDIWNYIKRFNLPYSKIYDLGYIRSGCVCCGFGLSLEEQLKKKKSISMNRFELLYKTNKDLFFYFFGKLKMWKCLADMNISLDNVPQEYLVEFNNRKKQVEEWYANKETNFRKILNEINERNNCFSQEEIEQLIKKYCL